MKIRIKTRDNWGGVTLSVGLLGEPGREYDVPDDEGATLCAEGLAEPVASDADEGVEKRKPGARRKKAATGGADESVLSGN